MQKNSKISEKPKQEIKFHYLKTNSYRSLHVDGAFGGVTPKGNIYMELFLERAPTPQSVTHEFNEDGVLGKEISRQSETGVIREIEAGIILDLATAESIRNWLTEKIDLLKSHSLPGKNK